MVAQQEVGEGCGGGFEVKAAGAYSRRGMRCAEGVSPRFLDSMGAHWASEGTASPKGEL